ncbi:MAG TPA: adenine deaminase [Chloroflexota bacterium]|nr:adenine deaminase [Chloroflexota bacterium]
MDTAELSGSIQERSRWIAIARGTEPADLVLKGGKVVSVFTDEVFPADVAISGGHVVGLGEYNGVEEVDVSGQFVLPGFIDGHCHIESSKLDVDEFARAVLRCGTTAVVVDPHEMANVLGVAGIEYVLERSEGIPLDVFVMIPSCVPASPFETAFGPLEATEFGPLLEHPRVLGIGEMMNYPAVIGAEDAVLEKLALTNWERIDGHAPVVSGRELNAYLVAGPATDHECTTLAEALEKRRLGMWVMIREASMIRNLQDLLPLVRSHGTENTLFVTDDREADTLLHEGHMNAMVRNAVAAGLDVSQAVKLASLNVARCHGLTRVGAVAPGYVADLCVMPDLTEFWPCLVLKRGRVVVEDGRAASFAAPSSQRPVRHTVHLPEASAIDLSLASGRDGMVQAAVVDLVSDQVVTGHGIATMKASEGVIQADPDQNIAKLAVVERHHASGRVGKGLVRGFGLRKGAFASTVAHDAHNVVVVGVDDLDMRQAVIRLGEMGGGLVVVEDGRVLGEMALPIAGLMSDRDANTVDRGIRELEANLCDLGVDVATPFMYLSFLALSVIPALRVTDQGIVDVERFAIIPLETEGA